jgi:hypothetical protein
VNIFLYLHEIGDMILSLESDKTLSQISAALKISLSRMQPVALARTMNLSRTNSRLQFEQQSRNVSL